MSKNETEARRFPGIASDVGMITLAPACSDDNETPTWKKLPVDPIAGADMQLTLNGTAYTFGSAQLVATSSTEAVLTLTDIVNGYALIEFPVAMTEQADGSFQFSGTQGLAAPQSTGNPVFNLEVSGLISTEGAMQVRVNTTLTEAGQGGGLAGTWPLSKDLGNLETGDYYETTPVKIVWSALDEEQTNGEQVALICNILVSQILSEVLSDVTLSADGNLTASYYPEIMTSKMIDSETGKWTDTQQYLIDNGWDQDYDVTTYWIMMKLFGYTIDVYPREWLASPKNLVTWYVRDNMIYLLPNLPQILTQVAADQGNAFDPTSILELINSFRAMDDATLLSTVTSLGSALGVDLSGLDIALLKQILTWLEVGVPLKYSLDGDVLKLYVDKEMAAPFMSFVLTFTPMLDKMLEEMAAENPMMSMLPFLLAIQKPSDLQGVWETNTDRFEIGLTFKPTPSEVPAGKRLAAPAANLQPKSAEAYRQLFLQRYGAAKQ